MLTTTKKLTFEEFLAEYPDGYGIFELVDGEIVQVEATRAHKNVSRYLMFSFNDEIDRLGLDYIVDKDIVFRTRTAEGREQGRNPDVGVILASVWNANVLAYGALTEPIQLAVEVVSTNWEDDYVDKLDEYQRLGIAEYWIVDYLAMSSDKPLCVYASRNYLGNPKVPSVFVYQLIDGKYQVQQYKESERIISQTFPELAIAVEQVVTASLIHKL